jgi:acyl-CoA synthetase (AMP-forming)/AMP-acid ligase II
MLLNDCVEYGAIKYPDRPALIFEDETTTFAALASRVRRVANAFSNITAEGDRVAVLSQNRREYVECLYGLPRAGLGLCLLNYRLSPAEIIRIINDAEVSVLIVESGFLETVEAIRSDIPSVGSIVVVGSGAPNETLKYETLLGRVTDDEPVRVVDENSLAWMIFTSGTTGFPKGVMLSHRNVLAGNASLLPNWAGRPGDVLLSPWPMCTVSAQIFPMHHILGRTIVLMRVFEPETFLALIERHHVTSTMGAPTIVSMLMRHPRFNDYDLSSLKTFSYGSAPMSPEMLRRAMTTLPDVGFVTNYGSTEIAGCAYYFDADEHERALREEPEALKSVGFQLPLSVSRIVDEEMRDVAPGEVGEIVIRGPQVMLGYWRNPEANAAAFAGGWFHTGDLARQDDHGRTYIVDRIKDMIITGGLNVYSREVELVLFSHPVVQEVAVIGVPDDIWGESVAAFVQVAPGTTSTQEELIDFCRSNLAHYKKPRYIIFVDEMPRNAMGKIVKPELRAGAVNGKYHLKSSAEVTSGT